MKANFFIPKYMNDFKCIGPNCIDTCCAGWDINIDENTFKKYESDKGNLKELINGKYLKNSESGDSFNYGFMKITKDNKCPFLNDNLLCEIHGKCGEENLSITCRRYPRVFNIIDDIYEKSGLPSCEEICSKAFLNKEKMEFIEIEEELDEDSIEIRRVIDTDAFIGSDNLIQYFWDIRVISINIMQNRNFSIEKRLCLLKSFYKNLETLKNKENFYEIEDLLERIIEDPSNITEFIDSSTIVPLSITNNFFKIILDGNLLNKIIGTRLKILLSNLNKDKNLLNNIHKYDLKSLDNYFTQYSYIFENYLVNQIFKDIIPFNTGEDLNQSIDKLINTYKLIKSYLILWNISSQNEISEKNIIYVIQALSKDLEHNKVFKDILTHNL
ncbi:flagellin lysine-N-methylase [Clostridium perfringens]|uniref:flagellin lysine-N-methylase n=1 Tax=Clostridium perfringens TaxID=1502 RepID=UPI00290E1E54|nr:flagellin lysine-N-methylase [Clostridium perfringens]EJT6170864.1 flagellin lysine-N-methylase [Clostridium perfringens]EJT6541589.1 flagellin lysine-N-methylase [Clostridium perfringens]EJT6566596.1 flagellin lysine-N-methylase [Clostridium perfringens]MBS5994669.1 flagellin lysine-N-methylase [Clostridium perfringens]MDM0997207.1 flagellin lysine-N-methylase [Clostridium perfringens]